MFFSTCKLAKPHTNKIKIRAIPSLISFAHRTLMIRAKSRDDNIGVEKRYRILRLKRLTHISYIIAAQSVNHMTTLRSALLRCICCVWYVRGYLCVCVREGDGGFTAQYAYTALTHIIYMLATQCLTYATNMSETE